MKGFDPGDYDEVPPPPVWVAQIDQAAAEWVDRMRALGVNVRDPIVQRLLKVLLVDLGAALDTYDGDAEATLLSWVAVVARATGADTRVFVQREDDES